VRTIELIGVLFLVPINFLKLIMFFFIYLFFCVGSSVLRHGVCEWRWSHVSHPNCWQV